MMSRWLGFATLLLLFPSGGYAFPPMSEEFFVDHGFRYHHDDFSYGCQLAHDSERVLFTYCWPGDATIYGRQVDLHGGEIDCRPSEILSIVGDIRAYEFSSLDDRGWKLAYVRIMGQGHPEGLFLCNVVPGTLEIDIGPFRLVPITTQSISDVRIASNEAVHCVLWREEIAGIGYLKLARFTADLTVIDPDGIPIASGCSSGHIAVDLRSDGGLVAWINDSDQVMAQVLSADGLPVPGSEAEIHADCGAIKPQMELCSLAENWLLCWDQQGNLAYARISPEGEVLDPGIVVLASEYSLGSDLTVAPSPAGARVFWICSGLKTQVIDLEGGMGTPDPVELPGATGFDLLELDLGEYRHNLDCAWTGEHFVAGWSFFYEDY